MKEEDLNKLIAELLISESQLIFNALEEHEEWEKQETEEEDNSF